MLQILQSAAEMLLVMYLCVLIVPMDVGYCRLLHSLQKHWDMCKRIWQLTHEYNLQVLQLLQEQQ